jgi:hypothetical protein
VTSTYPPSQPGPRPGPPPGGFRPGPPPPGGFRPGPPPGGFRPGPPPSGAGAASPAVPGSAGDGPGSPAAERPVTAEAPRPGESTGHPAVDAALRSLENAAGLAPGEQIAAYEDAHRVLQETLASIDG